MSNDVYDTMIAHTVDGSEILHKLGMYKTL